MSSVCVLYDIASPLQPYRPSIPAFMFIQLGTRLLIICALYTCRCLNHSFLIACCTYKMYMSLCLSHAQYMYDLLLLTVIIGASLSEPHINGTSMRELYIYIYYGTSVTQGSTYGHKREIVYCAFSCLGHAPRAVYTPF